MWICFVWGISLKFPTTLMYIDKKETLLPDDAWDISCQSQTWLKQSSIPSGLLNARPRQSHCYSPSTTAPADKPGNQRDKQSDSPSKLSNWIETFVIGWQKCSEDGNCNAVKTGTGIQTSPVTPATGWLPSAFPLHPGIFIIFELTEILNMLV